jgi:hypothetical protein
VSLSQAKKSFKRMKVPDVRPGIATAYDKLSELLDGYRLHDEAEAFRKKAETLWYVKKKNIVSCLIFHSNIWVNCSSGRKGFFLTICFAIHPWIHLQ